MLNKVEKFYIEQKCGELSPEQIAKDLKITPKRVVNYIKKCAKPETASESAPEVLKNVGSDVFGRTKDNRSVTMTKAAATLADDFNKGRKNGINKKYIEKKMSGKIHIIDPDKPSF